MSPRIKKIADAVQVIHRCTATHVSSVPVNDVFQGQTVWQGVVEVFDLTGHPKAKRCYAWSYLERDEDQFVAVLEIPPVTSPQTAVKAYVASLGRT